MRLAQDTKRVIGMFVICCGLLLALIAWLPRLYDAVGNVGVAAVCFAWFVVVPIGLSMLVEWAFGSSPAVSRRP